MPLAKKFKPLPRAFLMFTDLDGTFTPMDIMGKIDFLNIVKEIQLKENCTVKFIPVSGRPAGYVLRVLHDCRDILKAEGVENVCDYGAAEQGCIIVNCHKTYDLKYLGDEMSKTLKGKVAKALAESKFKPIVADELDKLYTGSLHIINEAKVGMSRPDQLKIYQSIKADIEKVCGEGVYNFPMSHNGMEVMSPAIKKSRGISELWTTYSKNYNIVGLMYAGDAENDKIAMLYVSHLAEIPGVNAHNFTPGNSQDAISSLALEKWKRENPAAHKHYIEKGTQDRFKGITELIRNAMACGYLTGTGIRVWETMDDAHPLHLKDLRMAKASDTSVQRLKKHGRRYSVHVRAMTLKPRQPQALPRNRTFST